MANFGSRFVYPQGTNGVVLPASLCPIIYDFKIKEIDTCQCLPMGTVYPAGLYTFQWSYYSEDKIDPGSISIIDAETGVTIADNIPVVDPLSLKPETIINIHYDITKDTIGEYEFKIHATGECGSIHQNLTITYCLPIFSEGNHNPALNASEIKTELHPKVQDRYPGTFNAFGGGYKYWAVPQDMLETDIQGSIRPDLGFRMDTDVVHSTDFVDPLATFAIADNPFGQTFNLMYAMNNGQPIDFDWGGTTYPYLVYRSYNIMNAPMFIKVLDHSIV